MGKTKPRLTIFEHSNDVLQIVEYLIKLNSELVDNEADLVRVGALIHDIGKIKQDISKKHWKHTSYSSIYLNDLLNTQRFQLLLQDIGISPDLDRDILLKIAEEHHSCCPSLLVKCKSAILVSIADVIASCMETGLTGDIQFLLSSYPYIQINLELIQSLGFKGGLNGYIHRIDLPAYSIEDIVLANMIFLQLEYELKKGNIDILLQKKSTLWVIGDISQIRDVLTKSIVTPENLYRASYDEKVYEVILTGLPPAGALQIDSIRYLLVNEKTAIKLAIALCNRKIVRDILERHNLSDVISNIHNIFSNGFENGVKLLWIKIRDQIMSEVAQLQLPINIIPSGLKRGGRLSDKVMTAEKIDKKTQKDFSELLKLFDCSSNGYRSLTNIILELRRMVKNSEKGVYDLKLAEYVILDGSYIYGLSTPKNKSVCPICLTFPQQIQAQALITGNPKTDSIFQTFRKTYSNIHVCRWCFTAGYIDLPISKISKVGQSVSKEREYLLINSPMSKEKLQKLIDFIAYAAEVESENEENADYITTINTNNDYISSAEILEIQNMIGESVGMDILSVYGLSKKRLSQLKGFALPTLNRLNNFLGVRVPVERMVGEKDISGSVKREIIKAIMFDFYRLTSGSLHYVTPTEHQFSIYGQEVKMDDMYRSSCAYRIADVYMRTFSNTKKSYLLDQGLFLELLNNPRYAVTLMWRKKYREGFLLGAEKTKEVITLAEEITSNQDWIFGLGLKIVKLFVENGWCPSAKGFWKSKQEQYTSVEMVKWIQSIKMVSDADSARSWGTRLMSGYRREHDGQGVNQELVKQVLDLVDEIVETCAEKGLPIRQFSRNIANMDLYLLFYYNHYKGGEL